MYVTENYVVDLMTDSGTCWGIRVVARPKGGQYEGDVLHYSKFKNLEMIVAALVEKAMSDAVTT